MSADADIADMTPTLNVGRLGLNVGHCRPTLPTCRPTQFHVGFLVVPHWFHSRNQFVAGPGTKCRGVSLSTSSWLSVPRFIFSFTPYLHIPTVRLRKKVTLTLDQILRITPRGKNSPTQGSKGQVVGIRFLGWGIFFLGGRGPLLRTPYFGRFRPPTSPPPRYRARRCTQQAVLIITTPTAAL